MLLKSGRQPRRLGHVAQGNGILGLNVARITEPGLLAKTSPRRDQIAVNLSPRRSKRIDRNLQEETSRWIGRRHMSATHVHLQRGDDQLRHGECAIARLAHGNERILADPVLHMDVVVALVADRRLPPNLSLVGAVIVAHEQARLARQRQDAADRPVKRARIAAREIGAR